MKALVLAAGYGKRLRPLTDDIPKALVPVGGKPLLEWHLDALAAARFETAVVNTAYLASQVEEFLSSRDFGRMQIAVSNEGDVPLETGGAMRRAATMLGHAPFAAINADVFTDFPLRELPRELGNDLAHLVLVPNPAYREGGDFRIADGRVSGRDPHGLTFAGIGVYSPQLIPSSGPEAFSIVPLLEKAMAAGRVSGQVFRGTWHDTGTHDRLEDARYCAERMESR